MDLQNKNITLIVILEVIYYSYQIVFHFYLSGVFSKHIDLF